MGRAYNASSDPDWKTTLRQAQSQGISQLVIAAQNLGASLFTSTEYANRNRTNSEFVTDLYAGYLQRSPDQGGYDYWLAALNGSTRDQVRLGFAYSTEFQNNVSRLCTSTSSTSASIRYVLTDLQGTTRAVMNNNGSSSAVISRHDYLPFGEELWAGIGSRSSSQAYGNTAAIRQKYGMTERDEATGLDHTWWRKYESLSGRWTSPDPLSGTVPQSLNAYTYAANDPVNFIDPSGLLPCEPGNYSAECGYGGFGGWGGGFDMNARVSPTGSSGRQTIRAAEDLHNRRLIHHFPFDESIRELPIEFGITNPFFGYVGGRGGGAKDKLPFNDCSEFVDWLVGLANNAAQRNSRLGALGAAVGLGTKMLHIARFEYDSYGNNGFEGFKYELARQGGQNQGVYSHVIGNAGAVLVGGPGIVVGNHLKDMAQTKYGNERQRKEGPAEQAGNIAGVKAGVQMKQYILGRRDLNRLKANLRSILCNPVN